jgi:Domain of unknown function (DUF4304)
MSKKLIIEQVDAVLKPLGFLRRGDVWNRLMDNLVEVVDVQFSKNADSYTLNAGVLDKAAHQIFWDEQPPEFVEQPQCTIGVRVGNLLDGKDKWWALDDTMDDAGQLKSSVAAILDFLGLSASRQKMIDWLDDNEVTKKRYPPPVINLAILQALTGQLPTALAILNELQEKVSGPWLDRVLQVGERLSLQNPVKAR